MDDTVNYDASGSVFNIQRFSLNDGPGIRTIVFLKGCPLHCKWCSNPESQRLKPVIMFNPDDCIHCGRCLEACKHGALSSSNPHFVDHEKCVGCGECAAVCPASALVLKGRIRVVQELIRELRKDASYFRRSEGGVTLSGGEPLLQHEFSAELLKACHAQGWTTAMETTGFANPEVIEEVIPHVDTVLLDIKSINPEQHEKFTGVRNDKILQNARRIAEISETIVRVPVVPTFNYSDEDIRSIIDFAKTMRGVRQIHLLPYHNLGENKYGLLGRGYELDEIRPLRREALEPYKKMVEEAGFICKIGG